MPIIDSNELKVFRAANQSDLSTNGGRMSTTALTSGVLGALFPNVGDAERTAGSTKYRKGFFKIDHNGPEALLDCRLYQDKNTVGDDRIVFFIGTFTDTQANITGSERKYGCGNLGVTANSGATSLSVTVETGTTGIYQNGDTIRITNKASIGASGDEEFLTISNVSQVSDTVTMDISPALSYTFSNTNTRVASVYAPGNLKAELSGTVSVVSTAGTFDNNNYPIVFNDKSTVYDTWTLTFTSATNFNIVGSHTGSVGTGTVSGGASPTNPAFALPYFTIPSGSFGGTFATNDTVVFTSKPAAIPVWLRRVVPAGAGTAASSTATIAIEGGTA
jgi:hypothetical protein